MMRTVTHVCRWCPCPQSHARHEFQNCREAPMDGCTVGLCDDCCAWQHECVICGERFHDEAHAHLNAACPEAR